MSGGIQGVHPAHSLLLKHISNQKSLQAAPPPTLPYSCKMHFRSQPTQPGQAGGSIYGYKQSLPNTEHTHLGL